MGRPATAKQRILESATSVVREQGAAHLTLDAVALHAGVSKGGVLYHFPNKRALLEAMVQGLLGDIELRTATHAESIDGANTWLRAMTLADASHLPEEDAMSLAILAAGAEDPTLLDPFREVLKEWFATVQREAGDSDAALLVLLANQGLRFLQMLDLLPLTATQTSRLRERVLDFAEREV